MPVELLSRLLKFQDQVNTIAPQILAAERACRASIHPISHALERLAINQRSSMIFGHTPRSILPTRKTQHSVVQRRSNPHQRRIGFVPGRNRLRLVGAPLSET